MNSVVRGFKTLFPSQSHKSRSLANAGVALAAAVRVTTAQLDWFDWERYSSCQRTHMTLGGLVGTVDLEGDLSPFGDLLRTAEILHVGKGATFGLGRIRLGAR